MDNQTQPNKFLTHITPQLDELVIDIFNRGYTPEEVIKPLSNEFYWWQAPTFEGLKLHFDSADMTFVGWLSACEVLTDSFYDFNLELIAFIKSTVERQWEIRMQDMQLEFNAEHEGAERQHEFSVSR